MNQQSTQLPADLPVRHRQMKIEAIIRPHVVADVQENLTEIGVTGMTILEVRGTGRLQGHHAIYRGAEYEVSFIPKIKLDVVVRESQVKQVIDAIVRASKTGEIGDGKIFVSPVEDTIRVRTNESGDNAL